MKKFIKSGDFLKPKFYFENKKDVLFFIARVIYFAAVLGVFFATKDFYVIVTEAGTHIAKKRILKWILIAGICVFAPLLAKKIKWPEWMKIVLIVLQIEIVPYLAVLRAEYIHNTNVNTFSYPYFKYNYLIALSFVAVFFIITNRIKLSVWLSYVLTIVLSVANYYLLLFRSVPLQVSDVYAFRTAMTVASDYDYTPTFRILWAFFYIGILWAFLECLPKVEWKLKTWRRLIVAVVLFYGVFSFYHEMIVEDKPFDTKIKMRAFRLDKSYTENGQLLTLVRTGHYLIVDEPEGYAVSKVKDLLSSFQSDKAAKETEAVTEENPNMIIIMNEALADFSQIGNIEMSEDCLEFAHSLQGKDNAITGSLHVNVFGGHTADTEYEVLTGNALAFLPESSVPYAQYIHSELPSLTWNLISNHYSGIYAFHPYLSRSYNRQKAYPLLGFQNTLFVDDIQSELTSADYLRNHVSDEADFNKVISLYEENRKNNQTPYYMFNVTMQNHSAYDQDFANFTQNITLSGNVAEDADAKRYINLVDYTDEAFKNLTEYFEKVDEPTVIVMFGDHEPGLSDSFYTNIFGKSKSEMSTEELYQRYQTPLFIWANYDINPDGKYDQVFENISANYLGAQLMNTLSMPMTAYQKYQIQANEQIPVLTTHGYIDKDNNYYDVNDKESPYYDLLMNYSYLVHNNQFDQKNMVEELFYLK